MRPLVSETGQLQLHLLCVPCFVRQAVEASTLATEDRDLRNEAVRSVLRYACDADWSVPVPEFGTRVHEIVKEVTGSSDPYAEEKRLQNQTAGELYGSLKESVIKSSTPLLQSVKVAIAGNVIDLAPGHGADLKRMVRECLDKPLDVNDFDSLKEELEKKGRVLYLADNAGEVFFDRILIEELVARGAEVVYVVKGGPILNDATLEDAHAAGIQEVVKVASTGAAAIGIPLDLCSDEFRSLFLESRLVISKGQGNYESLDTERGKTIFFMLRAKCPAIAESLGVKVGATVLRSSQHLR